MPWKSKKQQAWGHSPTGIEALGGANAVKEWDSATDFSNLPEQTPSDKKKIRHPGVLGRAVRKARYYNNGSM